LALFNYVIKNQQVQRLAGAEIQFMRHPAEFLPGFKLGRFANSYPMEQVKK
jgi:hypothetical protein